MRNIKDPKMVEAAKKAWETRRRRQQEGVYESAEPKPLPPTPLTPDQPIAIDYPEDMVLTAGADFLPWVEKYRPVSLTGVLGQPAEYLKAYVKTGSFPLAFVFCGDYGNGKTTAAKAFVRDYFVFRNVFQRDATFMDVARGRKFNPELEGAWPPVLYVDATITGDIETIRSKVLAFMRVISLRGYPKFCIFDEADRLGFSAQGALRSLLEKYPKTRTIYTTNAMEKIDEAIISRASGGVFEFPKPPVAEIVKYLKQILKMEEIRMSKSKLEEISVASVSCREAVGRLQQEAMVLKARKNP